MNKLIYILLLVVAGMFFSACEEEGVPVYQDKDRVNFVGTSEDNEDDPDYMNAEINFLGIKEDASTLILEVKVQGRESEIDRNVCFTVRDSTTPGVKMEFGKCVIPAGELRGECLVSLSRPSEEEELVSLIGIDYEHSDFDRGTYERQEFMVKVYDRISYEILNIHDGFWEDNYIQWELGPWSFTKAAFICRTLGITDFDDWYNDPEHWDQWEFVCLDKEVLKQALNEYKANPENPPLYDETLFPEEKWISFEMEW